MRLTTLPLLALLLGTAFGSAQAQVRTSADFTRWVGDAAPQPDTLGFEVWVNGVLAAPSATIAGDYFLGEVLLPGAKTGVEFKNRQGNSGPFNAPNLIAYASHMAAIPATTGTPFKFGTLTVTNGIFFSQAAVDVTFRTSSTNPFYDNRSFSDTLKYQVTPNDNFLPGGAPDHAANADFVSFLGNPLLGQIRVYEAASPFGNTGTVELWGTVGSLVPQFLANPTGGVYILPVPEPGSVWLLLAGGAAVLSLHRRRR